MALELLLAGCALNSAFENTQKQVEKSTIFYKKSLFVHDVVGKPWLGTLFIFKFWCRLTPVCLTKKSITVTLVQCIKTSTGSFIWNCPILTLYLRRKFDTINFKHKYIIALQFQTFYLKVFWLWSYCQQNMSNQSPDQKIWISCPLKP